MDSQSQHTVSDSRPSNTHGVMFMIEEIQKVRYSFGINWVISMISYYTIALGYSNESFVAIT